MLRKQLWFASTLSLVGILVAMPAIVTGAALVPMQAGGEVGETVIVGDVAYLVQGSAVSVWQLSSDGMTAPAQVGTTEPLPGLIRGLAVAGDYLFATWANQDFQGELVVFSLADPLAPARVLDFAYSTGLFLRPGDVVAIGDALILADPESGVYSIDISDPLAPSVGAQIFTYGLERLAVTGSHVIGWGSGFSGFAVEVIDVTTPMMPSTVGYYSSWGLFEDAAVEGDVMMLVGDGFEVVSLTDPTMPVMLTTVPSSGTYIRSALMNSGLAYLGDEDGLQVWDLSNPATPVAGELVSAPSARTESAAIHPISGGDEMIQFTGMGLGLAFDLDTPAIPTFEHVFDLPVGSDSTDVAAFGNGSLAVSDFYSGLRLTDDELMSLGRVDPAIQYGGYESLTVAGTTAYVTSWGYGLMIMDLADPVAPSLLSSVYVQYASAVDVGGDMAYVVTSTNGGSLFIFDVSNPQLPVPRGTMPISHGWDVVYHDGLALIADEDYVDAGLRVVDVSNPDVPLELGRYGDCNSAAAVTASGDLAFLACHDGTMHVVSIADPAMPTQIGVYTDPSVYLQGSSIGLDGSVVWFGHTGGVDILDVSDPAQPTRILRQQFPGAVRGMDVGADGNAWIAAANAGVYRVQPVIHRDGFESGDLSAWTTSME